MSVNYIEGSSQGALPFGASVVQPKKKYFVDGPGDLPGKESRSSPLEELEPLTVSSLSAALKGTLESVYGRVRVQGEISGLKVHSSGHLYFSLKDAHAVLDAVCWRGTSSRLACRPSDGLEVIASGKITAYPGRSKYQIVIEKIELTGEGSLLKLLEERKRKLSAEGLFDGASKKRLPAFPKSIALITSPTGAVIQDILHRLDSRFPVQVYLWPVAVQGEQAVAQICHALEGVKRLYETGQLSPDVLIVARGGGSLEDLWAFNDEAVVRAVAACPIPVISAVGHETDTTLIDYAADQRAPTPTAAAELAVPERRLIAQRLSVLGERLQGSLRRHVETTTLKLALSQKRFPELEELLGVRQQRLDDLFDTLQATLERRLMSFERMFERLREALRRPADRLNHARLRLIQSEQALYHAFRFHFQGKCQRVETLSRLMENVSYPKTLARGFCLATSSNQKAKASAGDFSPGEPFLLHFADGQVDSKALGIIKKTDIAEPI